MARSNSHVSGNLTKRLKRWLTPANLRSLCALSLPFIACAIQLALWNSLYPFVWFLFFPVTFFAAWLGGFRIGFCATLLCAILVWYFFIPRNPAASGMVPVISTSIFFTMGLMFAIFFERYHLHHKRSNERHALQLVRISEVVEKIAVTHDLAGITEVVRRASRKLIGADGITVILREDNHCYYADEDSIAPLWKGQRFALDSCISGWVILHAQPVSIADIDDDPRTPHELYQHTFVKSLSIAPVGRGTPIGAIGCYWAVPHAITTEEQVMLQALADAMSVGLSNLGLYESMTGAKKLAEKFALAASRSEMRYHHMFEQAAVGIALVSPDGRWLEVNQKLCDIVGYTRDELLAIDFQQITHPDDLASDLKMVEQLLSGATHSYSMEKRFLRKNDDDVWVNLTVALSRKPDDSPDYFISVIEDIQQRKLMEAALEKSRTALHESQNLTQIGNWEWNLASNSHIWSDGVYRIYGRDLSLPPASYPQVQEYFTSESWPQVVSVISNCLQNGLPYECDAEIVREDGEHRWITTRGKAIRNDQGAIVSLLGTLQDITARKHSEDQLRKLSLAVEQSPESILITDLHGNIEYVNTAFSNNSGYPKNDVLGRNPNFLRSGKTPHSTYESLWKSLAEEKVWQGEFINLHKDGVEYIEHAIVSPIRQPNGIVTHYLSVQENVTEKKRSEAEIHRLAFYDTLTNLPNRTLLLERLAQTLSGTSRRGLCSVLMLFNIDRFKTINDASGQNIGDALLRAVAERLLHTLRAGDVVARIAGDEFAILLCSLAEHQHEAAHQALQVAEKIHHMLAQPFTVNEEVSITCCIGVSVFPDNEKDNSLDILRRANTALHYAKTRGIGQTAFFDGSLDQVAKRRFDVERELHQAIMAGDLRVYLQSQVDGNGTIVGAEALVRWQHPQRGLIPPNDFIPIAEESNLIVEIGNWVFHQVCHMLVRDDMINRPIRIAVNISPRHFRQPDFVNQIRYGIEQIGANPNHLMLEVTEGMLIDNIADVIGKMSELTAMGIHFSMDDFGTGYSSLSYLKRLPIHELKIDRSFIQDITSDANDATLVQTILSVARHMKLEVVAEGVETAEQVKFLTEHGQVTLQGYYFSRPEPAEAWLKKLPQ